MRKPKLLLVCAVVTVVALVIGILSIDRSGGSTSQTSKPAKTAQPHDDGASSGGDARRSLIALPPVDAPLFEVAADLKKRARLQQPAAMCRLATEYSYCAELTKSLEWVEQRVAAQGNAQSGSAEDGDLARLHHRASMVRAELAHCDGVVLPPAAERVQLIRTAALKGHLPSMRAYVLGLAFPDRDLEGTSLSTYRNEVERIALSAASRGDAQVMFELAEAYRTPDPTYVPSLMHRAIEDDNAEALAIYLQLAEHYRNLDSSTSTKARKFVDRRIAWVSDQLSEESKAEAKAVAESRLGKWVPPSVEEEVAIAGITASLSVNQARGMCGSGPPDQPKGRIFVFDGAGNIQPLDD